MKPFKNISSQGNEQAFRKGKTVPDGDINLAYVQVPALSPEKNVVVLDTSRTVDQGQSGGEVTKKLYYANALGILEDENGDQLINDEFPVIANVFNIEEDYNPLPGSEYQADNMLPFVHVSRFFHISYWGQSIGSMTRSVKNDFGVRVIDETGKEYVDDEGKPKYAIKISMAPFNLPTDSYDQAPYRVMAYVDTDTNEDLYLSYNKVELDTDLNIVNQDPGWKEILNPIPYFEYQAEESVVVDPANRDKHWYSTKPLSYKQNVLGYSKGNTQGFRAYVPKKAVADPRVFQLFRWRVSCDFTNSYKVDPNVLSQSIKCGVIVTNSNPTSRAPYAFLNLQRSGFNATGVRFENPLSPENATPSTDSFQEYASYWSVNFDTVTYQDLAKFDILIWAPSSSQFDFSPYANKIDYFTNTLGGTIFIDSNTFTDVTGLELTFSPAINPSNGERRSTAGAAYKDSNNINSSYDGTSKLINGLSTLGGWSIGNVDSTPSMVDDEFKTLAYWQSLYDVSTRANDPRWYCQQMEPPVYTMQYDPDREQYRWRPVWKSTVTGAGEKYLVAHRRTPTKGNIIYSTAGVLYSCSALFAYASKSVVSDNIGSRLYTDSQYRLYINSTLVEGAMKLLFNACLLAVSGKILSDNVEKSYSTQWTFSTPWKSSWVINASNNVLSESERTRYSFAFLPKDVQTQESVWQRKLSDLTLKQLIESELTPSQKSFIDGANRTYRIETTNLNVETPSILFDESRPYAWTGAYSPSFIVPSELGPNVIKEEEVKGDYEAGQYMAKQYPPKPYQARIQVSYTDTMVDLSPKDVTWSAIGTAVETIEVTEQVPPSTTTSTSLIELTHYDYGLGTEVTRDDIPPYGGNFRARGIYMFTEGVYHENVYGGINNNWIHYGLYGQWGVGSVGEEVQFLQWALNRIKFFSPDRLYYDYVAEDGYYGPATATAIRDLQVIKNAKFIDGVVDAETLGLLGAELQTLGYLGLIGTSEFDYTRWGIAAVNSAKIANVNEGDPWATFSKRSWVRGGPTYIYEVFFIFFNQSYKMHGITTIPFSDSGDLTLEAWDMSNSYFYPWWAHDMGTAIVRSSQRVPNGQPHFMPMGPYMANSIAVAVSQDTPVWPTGARHIGIHDIRPLAEVTTSSVTPGYTKIKKQKRTIAISATGSTTVRYGETKNINAVPSYSGSGTISNVKWTSISTNNPNVAASISEPGLITMRTDTATIALDVGTLSATAKFTFGPLMPSTEVYYSMDQDRNLNPSREIGFVSKSEGIKILCNQDKTPYGFTSTRGSSLFPTGVGAREAMRHYTKIRLDKYATDANVYIGFYDIVQQEFVTNAVGEPEMSYIEYTTRGPQNIYIAVVTDYEVNTLNPIPNNDDAPLLPYRWAMPVYGVMTKKSSRITLEPVSKNLGIYDVWPVAIRLGVFDRKVTVPNTLSSSAILNNYRNRTLHAFYRVPEAESQGWSLIFGRPYIDVKDEQPILQDADVIQVRQAPFKVQRTRSVAINRNIDPFIPQFVVYKRSSISSPWTKIDLADIKDWNSSTGEIYLKTPLEAQDPDLVKVNYVTERRNYHFKGFSNAIFNLNPYPNHSNNLIGQSVYIYILPEFIRDEDGVLISGTARTSTINYTLNPNIFDLLRPEYDPFAVLLGIVYVSPSVDLEELNMFDVRRRGGGTKDSYLTEEILRLTQESSSYWDFTYSTGESYPKGGFVIIRLPAEVKDYLSEEQVLDSIRRNITAGVGFKLEDLEGNDW